MKYVIWAFLLIIPFFSSAQMLTPEQSRADFLYLKKKLDLLYPGVGYYLPDSAYNELYDSLANQLKTPVSYHEFYRQQVTPFIASLKDGHLSVYHRKNFVGKSSKFIPFEIRRVDTTYYISHNLSTDTSFARGTELLTLNGQRVADLHQLFQQYQRLGSDGDNMTGARAWSQDYFPIYFARWYGSNDSVCVSYRLPGDSLVRSASLPCLTMAQRNRYAGKRYRQEMKHELSNLAVMIVDSLPNTAILRVETFSNEKRDWFGFKYRRKLRAAFARIQAAQVQNLVIDMRSNGGGTVMNATRLLSYWMPEPFQVMQAGQIKRGGRRAYMKTWNPFSWLFFPIAYKRDSLGFVERVNVRKRKPEKELAYRGNLYFLMNGASYSATTSVLVKTLDAQMGTYIGEACGGAFWGDFAGQFQTVILPNSNIRVRVPLKKLLHDVSPKNANGFTVEPDFPVERTVEDLLKGRDYVMHKALNLIKQGKIAERNECRPSVAVK
ncbi:S41 family peptidase [Tellurirhabdus bombi]|uniref:S41 family peptidase n=1 Tax=Tellurirhabdus bombi TaxID=2907205 RepID=UPI001F241253|nr:S41 family peptidase [Tellurirhabdus bombi]